MRADEKPGRAGSLRRSEQGPSAIAIDFPSSSSIVTRRRAASRRSRRLNHRLLLEHGAHHDECHKAAAADIGPPVPIAELHDDVTRPYHDVAAVEQQRSLTFEQDAVINRCRLVDRRAEEILSAAIQTPSARNRSDRAV